jgi:hypothetical protein
MMKTTLAAPSAHLTFGYWPGMDQRLYVPADVARRLTDLSKTALQHNIGNLEVLTDKYEVHITPMLHVTADEFGAGADRRPVSMLLTANGHVVDAKRGIRDLPLETRAGNGHGLEDVPLQKGTFIAEKWIDEADKALRNALPSVEQRLQSYVAQKNPAPRMKTLLPNAGEQEPLLNLWI